MYCKQKTHYVKYFSVCLPLGHLGQHVYLITTLVHIMKFSQSRIFPRFSHFACKLQRVNCGHHAHENADRRLSHAVEFYNLPLSSWLVFQT